MAKQKLYRVLVKDELSKEEIEEEKAELVEKEEAKETAEKEENKREIDEIIRLIKEIRELCFPFEVVESDPGEEIIQTWIKDDEDIPRKVDEFFAGDKGSVVGEFSIGDVSRIILSDNTFNLQEAPSDETKFVEVFKKISELNKYFPITRINLYYFTQGFVTLPNGVVEELKKLSSLSFLDLSGNDLTIINEIITGLKDSINLTSVVLQDSGLINLPTDLDKFKNISELDISGNKFEKIPESLLNLKNLMVLKIEGLLKGELPSDIDKLEKLEKLDIKTIGPRDENFLKNIGELQNLKYLKIDSDELGSLPNFIKNLKKLEYLIIRKSLLEAIPDWIGNLENLKYLKIVSDNYSFNTLPNTIGNLENLESLNILAVNFTSLPGTIGNLKKLKYLVIEPGYSVSLSDESWQGIQKLKNLKMLRSSQQDIEKHINNIIQMDPIPKVLFERREEITCFKTLQYAISHANLNNNNVSDGVKRLINQE